MSHLNRSQTLLIVPPNDEEALLILKLAESFGILVHKSAQAHGAKLDREPDILDVVKGSGRQTVAIVEMPGVLTEKRIEALGKQVVIIDHHNYEDLERAYDADGFILPSSLEQFIILFGITDDELSHHGFDPRAVRAVGYFDAGYIWGILDAGYERDEVLAVMPFIDDLAKEIGKPEATEEAHGAANKALKNAEPFGSYLVIVSQNKLTPVRMAISRILAMKRWQPTSIILSERGGDRLYVQETKHAPKLFHHFGGFTFGSDGNWGYDNTGEHKITLSDVKEFMQQYV